LKSQTYIFYEADPQHNYTSRYGLTLCLLVPSFGIQFIYLYQTGRSFQSETKSLRPNVFKERAKSKVNEIKDADFIAIRDLMLKLRITGMSALVVAKIELVQDKSRYTAKKVAWVQSLNLMAFF
jgi:hypothetical protein